MSDIAYNPQAVIQSLSEQIASLTRDNAILLSALQVAQSKVQVVTPAPQYDAGENLPNP